MERRFDCKSIFSQSGNNNDLYSYRHISSGLYGYSDSNGNGESIADRDCLSFSGSHLQRCQFNNNSSRRQYLCMERWFNNESLHSQPDYHNYIFGDRYISSGLYRFSNSYGNCEPITDSYSHSCIIKHLPGLFDNPDCRRSKYIFMEHY